MTVISGVLFYLITLYQEEMKEKALEEDKELVWVSPPSRYVGGRPTSAENCIPLEDIVNKYAQAFKENQMTVFETRITNCAYQESTVPFGHEAYYENKIEFLISKGDYYKIQKNFIPILGELL